MQRGVGQDSVKHARIDGVRQAVAVEVGAVGIGEQTDQRETVKVPEHGLEARVNGCFRTARKTGLGVAGALGPGGQGRFDKRVVVGRTADDHVVVDDVAGAVHVAVAVECHVLRGSDVELGAVDVRNAGNQVENSLDLGDDATVAGGHRTGEQGMQGRTGQQAFGVEEIV